MSTLTRLHDAYTRESRAKADRYIRCRYTREEQRFLPLIENFSGRTSSLAAEIRATIEPRVFHRLRCVQAKADSRRLVALLQEVRTGQ